MSRTFQWARSRHKCAPGGADFEVAQASGILSPLRLPISPSRLAIILAYSTANVNRGRSKTFRVG